MEFYRLKKSAPFDMQDFLHLRGSPDSYLVFFKHFIKCITRKAIFEANIKMAKRDEDICTVSDEALALLLLENSWDKWMDQYTKDPSSLLPRRGRVRGQPISTISTKYTKGGYYSSEKGQEQGSTTDTPLSQQHNKGWSIQGIKRFNYFFDRVQEDRAANPGFFQRFLNDVKESKRKSVRRSIAKKEPPVIAHHSLFKKYARPETIYSNSQECFLGQGSMRSTGSAEHDKSDEEMGESVMEEQRGYL